MAKNCGRCGRSHTVSKKFKPAKGEYTTYEMELFIEQYGSLCQSCMEELQKEVENETSE